MTSDYGNHNQMLTMVSHAFYSAVSFMSEYKEKEQWCLQPLSLTIYGNSHTMETTMKMCCQWLATSTTAHAQEHDTHMTALYYIILRPNIPFLEWLPNEVLSACKPILRCACKSVLHVSGSRVQCMLLPTLYKCEHMFEHLMNINDWAINWCQTSVSTSIKVVNGS